MASYRVVLRASVPGEVEDLPRKDRLRVARRIHALGSAPRPMGCEKITGEEKFRVRQGEYRIIYSVDDGQKMVLVVKVGHRKEVYRSPR